MSNFAKEPQHPLWLILGKIDEAIEMIKMPVDWETIEKAKSSASANGEQAINALMSAGKSIVTYIEQEKLKTVAAALPEAAPMALPGEDVTPTTRPANDRNELARKIMISSMGGVHRLTPDIAFQQADALITEELKQSGFEEPISRNQPRRLR